MSHRFRQHRVCRRCGDNPTPPHILKSGDMDNIDNRPRKEIAILNSLLPSGLQLNHEAFLHCLS